MVGLDKHIWGIVTGKMVIILLGEERGKSVMADTHIFGLSNRAEGGAIGCGGYTGRRTGLGAKR